MAEQVEGRGLVKGLTRECVCVCGGGGEVRAVWDLPWRLTRTGIHDVKGKQNRTSDTMQMLQRPERDAHYLYETTKYNLVSQIKYLCVHT